MPDAPETDRACAPRATTRSALWFVIGAAAVIAGTIVWLGRDNLLASAGGRPRSPSALPRSSASAAMTPRPCGG